MHGYHFGDKKVMLFYDVLCFIFRADDVVDVLTDLISPGDDEFAEEMDTSPAKKEPGSKSVNTHRSTFSTQCTGQLFIPPPSATVFLVCVVFVNCDNPLQQVISLVRDEKFLTFF